ncbi:MAG: tetratricopeptide repeat protein [Flavobacteriales bacterium]|jgi:tetratricopeptide (TPR) repeat protein|uniref:tetratricopeptide repeat protein n=1 Tax=Candidatus Ulvibacter alkanivorans TaxID=2267620 RepID=UPI000DF46F8F|nr:tetratricopeptide repeat protein [Candidatus Ulvibacter alkanivorans]MCH2488596.1 tetratricopeptide repeat protein [Flavobacteriales bacterium]
MDHLTKLEELLDRANSDIKNGAYDEATNKLEKILDIDPDFGKAYNHLGYLYEVKFKEYEKGETLYKLCLEKSPMYPAVYYNYAVLLSTLGKYDDLKELLDTAITIPGVNKSTMYNEYGIMYEQLGKFDEAISYYKKAALQTLDKNVLNRAKDSIERCQLKKDLQ